ncbi:MAG TPA: helix-turn-helix transcriptional regulator [bacterium]|nr:helix-turn-helix transcriptional regulator [bacterium]HPS31322.1 helix-turn-helix transcriptional regulator [bacterium]
MNKIQIGQIIKERRKLLNIAQQDICEMAGVSQHTLSAIENGNGNPAVDTLLKILNILGIDIELKVRKLP